MLHRNIEVSGRFLDLIQANIRHTRALVLNLKLWIHVPCLLWSLALWVVDSPTHNMECLIVKRRTMLYVQYWRLNEGDWVREEVYLPRVLRRSNEEWLWASTRGLTSGVPSGCHLIPPRWVAGSCFGSVVPYNLQYAVCVPLKNLHWRMVAYIKSRYR